MSGTFIHPLACGFARGIAWQITAQVDADENLKCKENEARKVYQARLMRERDRIASQAHFNAARRIFRWI